MDVYFVVEHYDTEMRRWEEAEVDAHADLLRALPTIDGALVLGGTEPEQQEAAEACDEWAEPAEPEKLEPITFGDRFLAFAERLYGPADGRVAFLRAERDAATAARGR